MDTKQIYEYIFNMSESEFEDKFFDLVHTGEFSSVVSVWKDDNSSKFIQQRFIQLGLPEWCYITDEDLKATVKIIASRYVQKL